MFNFTKLLHVLTLVLIASSVSLVSLGQTSVFINEIHYDNASTDTGEAIEIAGPAGTDLSGWTIVLYNGSSSSLSTYNTQNLSGTIADNANGFGFVTVNYPTNGIQNGGPDGVALVNNTGQVVQFLSYEGSFTAANGPASGMTSTDIGVSENSSTPAGQSLQLTGTGTTYEAFTWAPAAANTFGAANNGQSFGAPAVNLLINEFVANHTSSDSNEFIELLGSASTDFSAYTLLVIEGDGTGAGTIDRVLTVGTTDANGYWTTGFLNNNIENGSNTILLVENFTGAVGNDLDTDNDGTLDVTPWDKVVDGVGINDGGSSDQTYAEVTLSRGFDGVSFTVGGASRIPNGTNTGSASDWVRNDFDGEGLPAFPTAVADPGEGINTPGSENRAKAAGPQPVNVVINEIDVDNPSTDSQEFIELYDGGTGNTSLDGLVVVLFNGSNNTSYNAIDLAGLSTNADGYFVIGSASVPNVNLTAFTTNGLQNGADAVALYRGTASDFPSGTAVSTTNLIDAIVYDTNDADDAELLALLNAGQPQVNENKNSNAADVSLQRLPNGEGGARNTTTYDVSEPTPGAANGVVVNPPNPTLITIAEARAKAQGSLVTVEGVLTVADEFGGAAFIQDNTGGIAVFDDDVHGAGKFKIGDQLIITATLTSFNDQLQLGSIEPANITKVATPTITITPKAITLAELAQNEGQLVKIVDVTFPRPGDLLFGNSNYAVTDASGAGQVRIDVDVASLITKTQPQVCEVTGVIGSFRGTPQLLPRFEADLPCATDFVPGNGGTGTDSTLEVVTWNIEWFGNAGNGPSDDNLQKERAKAIIQQLNADIYAFQEIADEALMQTLANELPDYELVIQLNAVSRPPNVPGESQKVAFLYKKSTVNVLETRTLLSDIHPLYNGGDASQLSDYPNPDPTRFYASGRLPFMMIADVTIQGVTEKFHFVNIHARANSGRDAQGRYDMRKYDVEKLKSLLDSAYANVNLVLAGDYNDDVDETVANIPSNVSSYVTYANDNAPTPGDDQFYQILTKPLSLQGFRSFVFSDNMIDHISVSDELVDNFVPNSETVHYEVYSASYANTTSDHLPVSVVLKLNKVLPLTIATQCSDNPAQTRHWTITNPNASAIQANWLLGAQAGTLTLQPGDNAFTTQADSVNTLNITWTNEQGLAVSATQAASEMACVSVVSFTLYDAIRSKAIREIKDGDVINLYDLPSRYLTVQANLSDGTVRSVKFEAAGGRRAMTRIENYAPYTLFGDFYGHYWGRYFRPGTYTLEATPFTGMRGTGFQGTGLKISFEFIKKRDLKLSIRKIFPNPSYGPVFIKVTAPARAKLMIYNQRGQLVRSRNVKGTQVNYFNLHGCGHGLFTVKLVGEDGDTVFRRLLVR